MNYTDEIQIRDTYLLTRNQATTARITHHSLTTVNRVLVGMGLGTGRGGNNQKKITDAQIMADISAGLTRIEIAEKHGVHVENLARRMRKLGTHARPTQPKKMPRAQFVERHLSGRFEYLGNTGETFQLRCVECGAILERHRSSITHGKCSCENCKALKKERQRLATVLQKIAEVETPKTCACCGALFYFQSAEAKYCSGCKRKARGYRERCKKYGVPYSSGITLRMVYRRDRGVCQICGEPVDWADKRWGTAGPMYPSIDHIKALANGGAHTLDNVQLAHCICNSYKGSNEAPRPDERGV